VIVRLVDIGRIANYHCLNFLFIAISCYRFDWFGLVYGAIRHVQQCFSYIVAVRFIGGGNRRKPPTYRKSRTNFGTYYCIKYTSPWTEFELITLVVIGTDYTGNQCLSPQKLWVRRNVNTDEGRLLHEVKTITTRDGVEVDIFNRVSYSR